MRKSDVVQQTGQKIQLPTGRSVGRGRAEMEKADREHDSISLPPAPQQFASQNIPLRLPETACGFGARSQKGTVSRQAQELILAPAPALNPICHWGKGWKEGSG